MHRTLLSGLTTLLLPFAVYGTPSTYGAYQRKQLRRAVSESILHVSPRSPIMALPSQLPPGELSITAGVPVTELVIVDSAVPDKQALRRALNPGADLVILDADEDALAQIAQVLGRYHGLAAVHVVSHGEAGALMLGDRRIDREALEAHPALLAAFDAATRAGADLLLYGCGVAAEDDELLEIIRRNTHLDVAASSNPTGAEDLGGDWVLEIHAGNIEASAPFSEKALKDFSAVLGPFGTKTFESWTQENYGDDPSHDWDGFTTYIVTPATYAELLSGITCNDDLYVSMYDPTSQFLVRSNPAGDTFGVTALSIRVPATGLNPATQVNIFGYEQGNPVAVGSKSSVPVSATETAIDLTTGVTGSFADIERLRIQPDEDYFCLVSVSFTPLDTDGTLAAAGGVTEPVGLATTVDTAGEAVDVLDFTLTDGGTGDGQPISVSQLVVHVSGTANDATRGQVTWRLDGPDAGNVTGTYDAGTATITFSGLGISVADAGSESYTINAHFNDNANVFDGQTIVLGIDGDVDLTLGADSTQMSGSNAAVANGTGTTVDVVATELVFIVQPAGSVSGNTLTTLPAVAAQDEFGNTDADFTETITLTEASAGSLENNAEAAVNGVATFNTLTYIATADQQSFTLTANDEDGTGSNLPTVDADAVISDAVATELVFDTQPAPLTVPNGQPLVFTVVPQLSARDAGGVVDTDYITDVTLAEVNGAGSALMSATGDTDGNAATVTRTMTSGVATFPDLQIAYTVAGSSNETFNLRASSGALTTADSAQLTAVTGPPAVSSVTSGTPDGLYGSGDVIDVQVAFDQSVIVTGAPQLTLETGTTDRTINYASGTGTNVLTFSYTVQSGDSSSDLDYTGTGALALNGGTIRDGDGNDAELALPAPGSANSLGANRDIVVDAVAPGVDSVTVPANGAYRAGETLSFTVNTTESVTVNTAGGTPRIALTVGATTRFADYASGSGTSAVQFTYTVQAGDNDADGIAVAASIDANGGTLRDAAGNDLEPTLNSVGATGGVLVDTTAPAPAFASAEASPSNSAAFTATLAFGETVTGFALSDVAATNATLSGLSDSGGGSFSFTVTPAADGTVTLDLAAGAAQDAAGNDNTAAPQFSLLHDATEPNAPSTPDLVAASDTGVSDSDDITSDATPTLTGTAEADATVRLSSDVAGVLGTTSATGGTWMFTPSTDLAEGEHQVTAEAIDAAGNTSDPSDALVLTIDLGPPDAADDTATTSEDTSVAIDVLANDSDAGSSLNAASVTVVDAPASGATSVNTANGVITYTPDPNFNGSDSFTYTVDDLHGGTSAPRTVSITVNPVNDPPEAEGDATATDEDTPVLIDVAANDTDVDDGDAPDPTTIVIVTPPADGGAVLEAGQVRYTPDADFNGTDQFTYTIADAQGAVSNAATVMINVGSVNDAPQAADDAAATDEDVPVTIDVLANDTDIDGVLDPASVTVLDAPESGTATVDAVSGEITFTPDADFNGTDTFTYVVGDNGGATSLAATVTVTVASVNDAPVAQDDTAVLEEDMPHVVNVLGNDSDADGVDDIDPATVQILSGPTEGVATVDPATGAITYTPGTEFHGTDTLTYRVADALGIFSNDAMLTLTVTEVNDVPLVNDDTATTAEDTPVTIDVLANDSDVDGTLEPPSVAIVLEPAFGTAVVALDGTVTYTPDANANGTDTFTYTVADDGGAVSAEATVTVTVTAVNDAPSITGTPPPVVAPGAAYLFAPTLTDPDGDALDVTATNLPPWLTLDPDTGALSGTPSGSDVGEHGGIVLTVSDGTAQDSLPVFSIRVEGPLDSDGDGMPDEYEVEQNFDPFDPADGTGDADGDGVSNTDEHVAGTDPHADDYAPAIDAAAPLTIDAVGLLTPLPALEPPAASDERDGAVTAELADAPSHLAPGTHSLTWRASDQAGNAAETPQIIDVRPQVSLAPDQARAEGGTAEIRFFLNGPSPVYPLVVEYAVDGTADGTDHDLVAGAVTFAAGEIEASVAVTLADDGVAEGSETLRVTLTGDGNFGVRDTHELTILEENLAPAASLSIVQGGREARILPMDGGPVTFTVGIDDPNPADGHSYEWQFPGGAVVTELAPGQQALDPSLLTPGDYTVELIVHDDGVPSLSGEVTASFAIVATAPELPATADSDGDGIDDAAEGYGDADGDGQPDYLDAVRLPNVLNEHADDGGRFLIEGEPGVRLLQGELALGQGGAGLAAEALAAAGLPTDEIVNVGGYFDFVVRDVAVGGTVRVAIPQGQPIPEHPLYRKFDGTWHTFVEDANNRLASAPGEAGVCPPPGSSAYTAGLTPGDWCVELTLEDGGANDADRTANGSIEDPGGVGQLGSEPHTTAGGGSGTFGWPLLLALLSLATLRLSPRRSAHRARCDGVQLRLPSEQMQFAVASRAMRAPAGQGATHGAGRFIAGLLLTAAALLPQDGRADGAAPWENVYLAVELGQADTNTNAADLEAAFAAAGNDGVEVTSVDAARSARRIALGYRLPESWALEAGYVDLGEVDLQFEAVPTAADLAAVHPRSGEGVTLAGLYRHRLDERLSLHARAGLLRWEADYVTLSGETLVDRHDASGTDLLLGIGADWHLSAHWDISLDFTQYDFDGEPTRSIGVGVAWTPGGLD